MSIGKICKTCGRGLPLTEQNKIDGEWYCNNCSKTIRQAKSAELEKKKSANTIKAEEERKRKADDRKKRQEEKREDERIKNMQNSSIVISNEKENGSLQKQIDMLMQDLVFVKSQLLHLQNSSAPSLPENSGLLEEAVKGFDHYRSGVEKVIVGFTWRRLVDAIKKRFGWEQYDIRDFYDKKKKRLGFGEIVDQTAQSGKIDPKEIKKMERWAKLFNRYARDGEPTHSEEIEAIMELLLDFITTLKP